MEMCEFIWMRGKPSKCSILLPNMAVTVMIIIVMKRKIDWPSAAISTVNASLTPAVPAASAVSRRSDSPRRRQRSMATVQALNAAAREVLKEKSIHALSISELCARIGMTTGAFYSSFDSKEAFFESLQRSACDARVSEFDALLAGIEEEDLTLDQICEHFVRYLVTHARNDHGLLRASMLHTPQGGGDHWEPFRELGTRYKEALVLQLAPHLKRLAPRERNLRIRFANQAIFSLIVHAVLNRPGPLLLEHEAFIVESTRMLCAYFDA